MSMEVHENGEKRKKGAFSFVNRRSRAMKRETDPVRRQNIRKNRKTFAWLSRFFRNRPSKRDLIEAHVLHEDSSAPAKNKFFGIPLEEVYSDESRLVNNVPLPVYQCAITIENFLDLEGIFRVSGTFSEMNRLTEEFEAGKIPDLTKVENKHSVSGLLEKYFRELPQPVTTWGMYEDFMKAADETMDSAAQIQYLQSLIQQMDGPNSALLGYFLALMKKISKHEDVNKMGAKNLGVVFGSIILGPENLLLTLGDKKKLQNQSVVVGLLIAHCYELFPQYQEVDGDDDIRVQSSADGTDSGAVTTTSSDTVALTDSGRR